MAEILFDRAVRRDRATVAALVAGFGTLLGAAAVVSPAWSLAVAVGLIFVAVTFVDLAAGLALFTILTFFERVPGFASSGLTLVKVAGIVLAAAWLLAVLNRDRRAPLLFRDHPLLAYAALLFLGWAASSLLWAEDGEAARFSLFRLAQTVLFLFIAYTAISERRHVLWVVGAFVAGAFLSAVLGLAGASEPDRVDLTTTTRLTGGIEDPNELAAIIVPALAFAAFALGAIRAPFVRWMLLSSVAVFAVALFMTQSRGGIVALGATFLAAIFLSGRFRPRALALVLVVSALGVSYYTLVAPPESIERISQFTSDGGTGRTDLWSVAVEMAKDNPILGVGVSNFEEVEPRYAASSVNLERVEFVVDNPKVAHSTYLEVLAELGAIGLAAFAAVVLGPLVLAARAVRAFAQARDGEMEALARGFLVGILGMLAAFVFISAQYEKQLWLLLAVAAALLTVARRSAAVEETAPTGPQSPRPVPGATRA
ncbi:MAG TPA: O-antigen ligase family protein [Gaiellaceae bacterium]|nr:O-antigen ligase family protein [Gaiellaceae bacterium]